MRIPRAFQIFIFLAFTLCLNWPILSVTGARLSGYPLFVTVFVLWGVMIVALAAMGRCAVPTQDDEPSKE